jgi:AhpD family alkylhydroperoxidase
MSTLAIHAHIEPLPAERRSLFTRFVRWFARRRFGRVPSVIDAYAHAPAVLFGTGCFELAAERSHVVDKRIKSLCELKVAALVGCRFCLDIGSAVARGNGVTAEQAGELPSYATSAAFTPLEKRALDLATAMTETPVHVPEGLFNALRSELGDAGFVELAGAIAWENFRARMNHGLGLPPDGFSEGAFCALPEGRDARRR